MRTLWIVVASLAFVYGCACEPTPYQRAAAHSGKGYSEKRAPDGVFYVTYVGNTCTTDRLLSAYLHRRAAELTLQYGFRYFVVLREPRRLTSLDARELRVDRQSPRQTVVLESQTAGTLTMPIQCFHDAQESSDMTFIDAKEYPDRKVRQ